MTSGASARLQEIQRLRQAISRSGFRTADDPPLKGGSPHPAVERIATCNGALDRLFPRQEIRPGTLVEWLSRGEGGGASLLAWMIAGEFQRQGIALVVLDPDREFYPPGVRQLDIDLDRVIVVQPVNRKELLWTFEQSLRCAGDVIVIGALGSISQSIYRRLKLAAERGGNLGFFLRPWEVRGTPAWADFRLLVEPVPSPGRSRSRRLKVSLLGARGGEWRERNLMMDIHDESGAVSVVSELERAAAETCVPRAS